MKKYVKIVASAFLLAVFLGVSVFLSLAVSLIANHASVQSIMTMQQQQQCQGSKASINN